VRLNEVSDVPLFEDVSIMTPTLAVLSSKIGMFSAKSDGPPNVVTRDICGSRRWRRVIKAMNGFC